jgi:hypothetical protein
MIRLSTWSNSVPGAVGAFILSLALSGSGCTTTPGREQASSAEAIVAATNETEISALADELLELAAEAELWITPTLSYLADYYEGDMVGLEFRFKSRESTIGKIKSRMQRDNLENPRDASIRDSLRYTMRFTDQPAGHHDDAVAGVLALMESTGHTVLTVRNYWPRGDDYSGINTTLKAPNGIAWELQFHTPASFDLKMSTHVIYEQVRKPDVALELRQDLFEEVTKQWDVIPIPADVLEPGSIHRMEEIIVRPRP